MTGSTSLNGPNQESSLKNFEGQKIMKNCWINKSSLKSKSRDRILMRERLSLLAFTKVAGS